MQQKEYIRTKTYNFWEGDWDSAPPQAPPLLLRNLKVNYGYKCTRAKILAR